MSTSAIDMALHFLRLAFMAIIHVTLSKAFAKYLALPDITLIRHMSCLFIKIHLSIYQRRSWSGWSTLEFSGA